MGPSRPDLVAAVPLLMGTACLAQPPSLAESIEPPFHQELATACRDFQQATFYLQAPGPIPRAPFRAVFYVDHHGHIVADSLQTLTRLYWDGHQVTSMRRGAIKRKKARVDTDLLRGLWDECRSGFANSTWHDAGPWDDGLLWPEHPDVHWARLELPEALAQADRVYVGISAPRSGELHRRLNGDIRVLFVKPDGSLTQAHVHDVSWSTEPLEVELSAELPDQFAPWPEFWGVMDG